MTHQGIAFDEFGNLIDGQHRLHAIVKSGKTITCLVSFGVHVDAVSVIDRGLRRSSAVVLGEQPRAAEIITFITRLLHSSQFGDDELLQDAIGDVFVTIVILSQCSGLDFTECVRHAYNEIKDRKGKLVDGIFIKEE
jgi:hypothetical protein